MTLFEKKNDVLILGLITLGTLILRYITLMEVNVGGDNIDYWYYAKSLLQGYPYDLYFHRSVRWGIILPTMLVQMIFGNHAWTIYLPSVLASLILNYAVFLLGSRLFRRRTVYLALIIIQFFPYMIRMGSQLFLGIFSMNYILFSFYFLLRYLDGDSSKGLSRLYFSLSLLLLFLAYLTKITNLYFLFPWLLLLWKRHNIKSAFIYGLILLGFYLCEHVAYYLLLGETLGRLGIITATHLGNSTMQVEEGTFNGTFLGLFARYSLVNFPLYWQALLWPGLGAGIFLTCKKVDGDSIKLILLPVAFFLVLLTFGVKSLNPVIPFETFMSRYFSSILPFLALLLSRFFWYLSDLFRLERIYLKCPERVIKYYPALLFSLPLGGLLILANMLPHLPTAASEYLNPPFSLENNRLAKVSAWEREINNAAKEGYLLSCWTLGPADINEKRNSKKSLDTVNRLYLRLPSGMGNYAVLSEKGEEGTEFQWLEGLPGAGTPADNKGILRFYREPFESVWEDWNG